MLRISQLTNFLEPLHAFENIYIPELKKGSAPTTPDRFFIKCTLKILDLVVVYFLTTTF